jgi:hypothetical protein
MTQRKGSYDIHLARSGAFCKDIKKKSEIAKKDNSVQKLCFAFAFVW